MFDGLALPLRLGVNGIKHKMKEEGLFRIGPSIPIFNKVKGLIDAGADEMAILAHYKDPHLYTAMIKYYLRELPEPIFCSDFTREWLSANKEEDDLQRSKQIEQILNKLPQENKTNIQFLFDFLARVNTEEVLSQSIRIFLFFSNFDSFFSVRCQIR